METGDFKHSKIIFLSIELKGQRLTVYKDYVELKYTVNEVLDFPSISIRRGRQANNIILICIELIPTRLSFYDSIIDIHNITKYIVN